MLEAAASTNANPWTRAADWFGQRGNPFWAGMLIVIGLVIYLPYLGAYPLWDPWEPHYTQVAWEMQERGTWFNPWYRGIDNWWSKPILMLWMLRASLGLFWDHIGDFANNELYARLPFALFAVFGGVLQYDWSRRLFGRKVGILSAIVLITAPQYLLIGRQVMVDTIFVATYAAAMGYLALGLFTKRPPLAAADAPPKEKALAWWSRNFPFVGFWGLQAVAVLSKGFVPPALAVLILAGYWLVTFRWRDYAALVEGRDWKRYVLIRGGIALGIAGAAFAFAYFVPGISRDQRLLYQAMIGGAAGLGISLGVFHDLPPSRHALNIVVRMRVLWGLPLFVAISAPWYIYMSIEHGWPYWNEWIFYHHIGRAAGTIDKPSNTFDYFIKQVGYALFPWSAFLLGAAWRYVARCNPFRSTAERRNLFILFSAVIPYLFFSLSGTKFAHYIFPVIPFLGTIIAVTLIWLSRPDDEPADLGEEEPRVGPELPVDIEPKERWYQRAGSKGELMIFTGLALVGFGILAHDLVLDYRLFLRLFLYYYNRATPFDYQPFVALQFIFFPLGILIAILFFSRLINRWHLTGLSAGAVALACYLSWVTMPAMGATYSFKPFLGAYQELSKPGEPIAQFNDWQQPVRSVIYLFQNRCVHLRTNRQAEAFLKRPGRKFIMVDRNRLASLRRVARDVGVRLYVVFDGHPYGRLVSDQPNSDDSRKAAEHILTEVPAGVTPFNADFDGKIKMVGFTVEPPEAKPGERVMVSFYYEALSVMDRDWQIFVHGDGPRGGSHRLHIDHFPLDGLYPTTEWQEGEVIRDTFEVDIPGDYPYDSFVLWHGFYIGDTRLELKNRPPNDGQNRVRGPRIVVKRE